MINLSLFASLTGLHLAIMQFCYFFVLLINVTSTYITYMTVVIAWMAGTLLGLWLRINAGLALLAGVVGFYAVYLLVINDPLSPTVLPISAIGVAVTGLWAGRFFVVMLPLFGRSDRLFFHENNGFMLGIIGVFIGFTLLGKPFLLWTPLISVLLLLLHMAILGRLHQHPDLKILKRRTRAE
jgi:choline-glycine betaine transporter